MITGLIDNIPKNEWSHNRAYAKMWEQLINHKIETDISGSDDVYLYLGINHSNGFNIFGGLDSVKLDKLERFLDSSNDITVLDHSIKNLGDSFRGRIGNKTTDKRLTNDFCDALNEKSSKVKTIKMSDLITDQMVIGDSHSMSIAPNGVPVIRIDGKTMNGVSRDHDFILDQIPSTVKKLTISFGSIDIRHHLFRFDDPYQSGSELLDRYFDLIDKIDVDEIEIAKPIPIETETRKMAKTTMYKDKPFSGSREDRLDMTYKFIDRIGAYDRATMVGYPDDWYSMNPEVFESTIMERPRGIHVGYPNYRINDYGINNTSLERFF